MAQRSEMTTARIKRASRAQHDEVEKLLTRLSAAMTAGDGEGAARCWETPAFVIGSEMVKSVATHEEVAQFFAGAREMYNARGITDTKPDILDEDWIDDQLVVVKVRWPYLDESGGEIGAEASDYTLARSKDGQLRIRIATMRGVEGTKDSRPS